MAEETLRARQHIRGYDGRLFHDGDFLAEINTWQGQVSPASTDEQPAGSKIVYGITTGYSVSLTFTETVVRDTLLLKKLLDHIKEDEVIDFDFVSRLQGRDETREELVFRECEPSGTIDLVNVSPGTILKRSWNWRVNSPPDLQKLLGVAA